MKNLLSLFQVLFCLFHILHAQIHRSQYLHGFAHLHTILTVDLLFYLQHILQLINAFRVFLPLEIDHGDGPFGFDGFLIRMAI